ncbi:hypothetical protein ACFL9T_22225 [Thermodesulfobacteriota bacterium]
MNASNTYFQGALIVHGLITEDAIWDGLIELLREIEDLPQPLPWISLCDCQLYLSVHRKNKSGDIIPPLKWADSELSSLTACAAIAFKWDSFEEADDQGISEGFAEGIFRDFARTFAFAANIARPGCFDVMSVVTRCSDGSYKKNAGTQGNLWGAVEYSQKTGWPPLTPVPFASVYTWIAQNFFHLRHGDTPVSRAFNAYTWLFEKAGSHFPFGLVSALIGIEALFATTTSGVADQVRRRAQLLLGDRTTFKKDLDKMYSARSAFLHGSTLLPQNGFDWNPPEPAEVKLQKTSQAEDIAAAVLLSSLQRLVERGWTSLEFSENLSGADSVEIQSIDEIVRGTSIPYAYPSKLNEWIARFSRRFD